MPRELSQDELRAALAAADKGMRLPWPEIVVAAAISAAAVGIALKFADRADPVHVIIACAAAFLWGQLQLAVAVVTARQNAANARMLRALELLDERLDTR